MSRGYTYVLAMLLAAGLLLCALPVLAQNSDDPPPQQEDPPPSEDPQEEPAQDPEADPADDPDNPGKLEEDIPETAETAKIRARLRPSSDEEERAFKRQATRNDPFLNPLLPLEYERLENSGYNPRDSIRREGFLDLSRYIVQDEGGTVQGFLTLHNSLEELPLAGRVMNVIKLCEYGESCRIELQVQLDSLRPTVLQVIPTDESRSQQAMDLGLPESLRAEYLFDRITVHENVGGITGKERLRMLPFSFDINQLDSLVRAIDYDNADWPMLAILFDPQERLNFPMSMDAPRRVSIRTAELEDVGCYELTMNVGNEVWGWWVERLEPHRLVKFTRAGLSFTLMSYTQGQ